MRRIQLASSNTVASSVCNIVGICMTILWLRCKNKGDFS